MAVYSSAKLSSLDPNYVYSFLFERISFILSSENFGKQISGALETSSSVLPAVVTSLAFSRALSGESSLGTSLLLATLPAIDINDTSKTYAAIKFYYGVLSYIPIIGQNTSSNFNEYSRKSSNTSQTALIDEETSEFRKGVVSLFDEWAPKFLEKICEFLYHKEKNTFQAQLGNLFNLIYKRMIKTFFTQLSTNLYSKLLVQLADYLKKNIAINAKKEFGHLCVSAVLRDPSTSLKEFSFLYDIISSKSADKFSTSENKTIWNIYLLSKAVRYAGRHLLPHREKILSVISISISDPSKKSIVNAGLKLLRNTLKSLTLMYPTDYYSHTPYQINNSSFEQSHWEQWGPKLDKNRLGISWHKPTSEELRFASEIITKYGGEALTVLDEMSHPKNDKVAINHMKMSVHLSTLRAVFHGGGAILPDLLTEEDYGQELASKNELSGLVPLSDPQKASGESSTQILGIPENYLLKEFREKTGNIVHSVALRFLQVEQHKDYFPVIRSLVKVLVTLSTTRETVPQKYTQLTQGFNTVKRLFKNHLTKALPRAIYVEKQYVEYLERVDSLLYGLPFNKQAKNFLDDLIGLYCAHFEPLQGIKESIIRCFRKIPLSLGYCLPKIIHRLENKDCTESEIQAAVDLLSAQYVTNKINKKWNLVYTYFKAILRSSIHEKANLQTKLFGLFGVYLRDFYAEPITITPPSTQQIIKESKLQSDIAEKAHQTIIYNNKLNHTNFINTLNTILEILDLPQLHWRYQLMSVASLLMLLRRKQRSENDTDPANDFLFGSDSLVKILKTAIHILERADLPIIRTLAIQLVHSLLLAYKPLFIKKTSINANQSSLEEVAKSTQVNSRNSMIADKVGAGWNGSCETTITEPIEQVKLVGVAAEFQKILIEKFSDKTFVTKLLYRMGQDHNFKDEEEKDREMKALEGKFSSFAKALDINIEALIGQFGGSNENKTILTNLVGSQTQWPTIRLNQKHIGRGFSSMNAHFWKLVFLWVGRGSSHSNNNSSSSTSSLFSILADNMVGVATNEDERGSQCAAAEWFAGAVRASKYMENSEYSSLTRALSGCLSKIRDFSFSKESLQDWATAIQWSATDQNPARLVWLTDTLIANPFSTDKTSQLQVQHLKFIESILQEFSWRGIAISDKVLEYLNPEKTNNIEHPYKQVRESIASLLLVIFSAAITPNRPLYSNHVKFVESVTKKLADNRDSEEESIQRFRETVAQWISFSVDEDMTAIIPYVSQLLPHIFAMQKDNAENTRNLSKVAITLTSQLHLPSRLLNSFIQEALVSVASHPSWRVRSTLSPFLQIFVFNHSFFLSTSSLNTLLDLLILLMGDKQIEVAETARKGFSSVVRATITSASTHNDGSLQALITRFEKLADTKLPKKADKSKEAEAALVSRHVGILGLSALVESQPYEVPDWLPKVVSFVAQSLNDPHPIKKTAGECIKEFWRTHQDEWVFFQEKFTFEQISAIKQSTSLSYYA